MASPSNAGLSRSTSNDGIEDEKATSMDEETEEKAISKDVGSDEPDIDQDEEDDETDGQLSRYELLRLERIKRNQEYLSKLGLNDTKKLPRKEKKRQRKRSSFSEIDFSEKRSSGRVRKSISYTEPTNSVRNLLNGTTAKVKPKSEKPNRARGPRSSAELSNRMERFIFREFQRIKSKKTHVFRQTDRLTRAAEKEVAYWQRQALLWERRKERRSETERQRHLSEQERATFGGGTLKQFLQEIDKRMPTLLTAASEYDEVFTVGGLG